MNIIEISTMSNPDKMKAEVSRLAHKRKCSENDIWELINNFRKTHEGKRSNAPEGIGDTLDKILSKVTITNKSARDILADELSKRSVVLVGAKVGKYVVDLLIHKANLIIDIDKRKHTSSPEQQDDDFKRQLYLIKKGYSVMRFTGSEIYRDVVGCVNKIQGMIL